MVVKITNLDKELFTGITKGQVAEYYRQIAPYMLPYIRGRKLSLVVCPQGVKQDCFYKKNTQKNSPLTPITCAGDLMEFVQNNALEFHVFASREESPNTPDMMVFDLDPDEGISLSQIRQGAFDLKQILDELDLVSFLKTSGNKGYHIVVPLEPLAKWESLWESFTLFAKQVAQIMEKKWPNLYTTSIRKIERKGKIFIDWIRNSKGHTSIAPYSVRAKEGARVSVPISWEELDLIAPNEITMDDAIYRAINYDPWKKFFTICQKLKS